MRSSYLRPSLSILVLIALILVPVLSAFVVPSVTGGNPPSRSRGAVAVDTKTATTTTTTRLCGATTNNKSDNVIVTTPSQIECESMGVREWPQRIKGRGTSTETAKPGTELVRYILEGEGSLVVDTMEGNDHNNSDDEITQRTTTTKSNKRKKQSQAVSRIIVRPGNLIRITGPATLTWEVSSVDMIILTPGYEQGGLLLVVAGGLIALVTTLIFATTTS